MKTTFIFLLCSFGSVSAINPTAIIRSGITAGQFIIDVLKDNGKSGSFAKFGRVSTKLQPFFSALGPIIGIAEQLRPDPVLEEMRKGFANIDNNFNIVYIKLDDIKKEIDKSSLKLEYSEYVNAISSQASKLSDYLKASSLHAEYYKNKFMDEFRRNHKSSTYTLWNGMMKEGGSFSETIPSKAIKFTVNHRAKIQKIMKYYTYYIMKGVELNIAYARMQATHHNADDAEKSLWIPRLERLIKRMQMVDDAVKNAWEGMMEVDVKVKLITLDGQSNSYFATKVYEFLEDKYDWRDWHVVAYNPISGFDDHCLAFCTGLKRFRTNGRNTVIASVDSNKPRIDTWETRRKLRSVRTTYRSTVQGWLSASYSKTYNYRAETVYDHIPSDLRNGCTISSLGVIRRNADIQHEAKYGRLASVYNGDFNLYAFG